MCEQQVLRPVRDDPEPRPGKGRLAVRLHQALRPGAGRPGRVPAGAAGPLRADQGARERRPTSASCSSPTCCPPPGRRSTTRRSPKAARRRLRARADRPDERPDRPPPGRRARSSAIDNVPERLEMARRNGIEAIDFDEHDDVSDGAARADRRARPRQRDRRGRDGGARRPRRRRWRRRSAGLLPDAVAAKMTEKAAVDRLLGAARLHRQRPPRRHRLDLRRLRRPARPAADDADLRQGPAAADGPGPRAASGPTRSCRCWKATRTRSGSTT